MSLVGVGLLDVCLRNCFQNVRRKEGRKKLVRFMFQKNLSGGQAQNSALDFPLMDGWSIASCLSVVPVRALEGENSCQYVNRPKASVRGPSTWVYPSAAAYWLLYL